MTLSDVDLIELNEAFAAQALAVPRALRRRIAPRPLSHREKQVLSLVVSGYTNRQIANELFLAESTIKTHLSSAFAKIGASSRAEAAAVVLDPDLGYGANLFAPAPASDRQTEDRHLAARSIAVEPIEQMEKL